MPYQGWMRFRAAIRPEFLRDSARLLLARSFGDGREDFLMEDGTWRTHDPTVVLDAGAGVLLPLDSIDAVYDAIKAYKGDALDSNTEAKVLREWREAESDRVTDLIYALRELFEQQQNPLRVTRWTPPSEPSAQ